MEIIVIILLSGVERSKVRKAMTAGRASIEREAGRRGGPETCALTNWANQSENLVSS
jgi:hypothetical protein